MYEVRDPGFPANLFSFKTFADISSNENEDQTSLFDIIGVITAPRRDLKQNTYRLIEVEISDEHHNKILCTIWDSNMDSYLSQLKMAEGTVPIIIEQFCKPNVFRGEIGVSTHYQASKILINADVADVKEFKKRIKDDDTFIAQGSVDQAGVKHSREFDDLAVKCISDVVCLEKVRVLDANKFRCDFCIKNYDVAVKRFKFVVNVVDDTSNASLLLWDREVVQRVTDLIGTVEYIPRKLEELLLGQKVLFKVQSRNNKEYYCRYPYTVNKICNIPEIVEKHVPLNIGSQVLNSDVKLCDLLFGDDIVEVSGKGFVTPDLSVVTKENGVEWVAEGSVKRCLEDEFDSCDDFCFGKIKKKMKKANVIEEEDEASVSYSQDISIAD
ncbi:uncharacterized protein LOC121788809 [Salvia splendens]|uniref:uncharacterized protein LOC121788809 n=1 Tax=Salvia splendens TaxID=180675 RepID=UPI001C26ED62|nr:uncharacterized protein LOC121788809 [Salvia splendens]